MKYTYRYMCRTTGLIRHIYDQTHNIPRCSCCGKLMEYLGKVAEGAYDETQPLAEIGPANAFSGGAGELADNSRPRAS